LGERPVATRLTTEAIPTSADPDADSLPAFLRAFPR
jgi:hypothetical protein